MIHPRPRLVRILAGALLACGVATTGCGPPPSPNLSPTAEQDPERSERAARATEERIRKNQEAERKAVRRGLPAGLAGH